MASTNLTKGIPKIRGEIPAFIDFAPDLDPTTPGAVLDINNMYATTKGYRTYPSLTKYSVGNLVSSCLGTWAGMLGTPGTMRLIAGVVNQLYTFSFSTLQWTTANITSSSQALPWRFDVYGNYLMAVNGIGAWKWDGTNFTIVGGSPPASSIVQATDFSLFLIEKNTDKWHSSLSAANWTDSIAAEVCSGELDSTDGEITAAHSLRGGIALYKRNALYYATFDGPPFYWNFKLVSAEVGAPSQEAIAHVADMCFFPGPDDFYFFDSYSLNRIPNNLREWFFATLDQYNDSKIAARWDLSKQCVFWHFPSINSGGALDSWICLNIKTGKWSKGQESIDAPIFAPLPISTLTYDTFTTKYPTYNDVTGLKYGDLVADRLQFSGVIKTSDHGLYLHNGAGGSAYLTTNDFGDWDNYYQCLRVRPHFAVAPAAATLQPINQRNPGTAPTNGRLANLYNGRFNVVNTARLQRFKIAAETDMELTGMDANIDFAGEQ